jgi:hypothetical protein
LAVCSYAAQAKVWDKDGKHDQGKHKKEKDKEHRHLLNKQPETFLTNQVSAI